MRFLCSIHHKMHNLSFRLMQQPADVIKDIIPYIMEFVNHFIRVLYGWHIFISIGNICKFLHTFFVSIIHNASQISSLYSHFSCHLFVLSKMNIFFNGILSQKFANTAFLLLYFSVFCIIIIISYKCAHRCIVHFYKDIPQGFYIWKELRLWDFSTVPLSK